jgi:hypothetical protein
MVRLRLSIGPSRYSSFRYSRENCAHETLPSWNADRRRSLGPRLAIQTSYRDAGRPRPRKRVTRIRRPSLLRLIAFHALFVFSGFSLNPGKSKCRHQVLGPLPVGWTPTLSPEHVTCKPFSDTPNPYGMRRRNKGTYEPYNTNNGENHCILAKYVTRWVRWTRAGLAVKHSGPA